ncbi:MAG: PQQ-binding-like beta-propeller repeat protein [Verrucomicrobia bacterium]|nr:PQQ-binding-like beta-propeller repeat protein [Verrucomicrobiota bacterium]
MATAPDSPVYRTAVSTAWVAGVFLVVVAGAMLYQRLTANSNDPWKSPQLLELKEQLRASPKDEKIKERIRELDLKFRQRYVRRLALTRTGGWLLLGGSVILVVALATAMETRKVQPLPRPDPTAGDRAQRDRAVARRAVGVAGAAVAVVMVGAAATLRSPPTVGDRGGAGAAAEAAKAAVAPLPPASEFAANWPQFRGPGGSGVATAAEVPLSWNGASGAGVAWKTPVPEPGFNSPIVWGDRIFCSGGTREKRVVMCFDLATGRLRWDRVIEKVPGAPAQAPEISDQTGYAAPTMATDGVRAYAIFATGELAAVNFDGSLAWAKHLGVPKNLYGHATSLAVWQGRVIVQLDQGESGPANSRIMAFDGVSGKQLWEKARSVPGSWSSPIVIEAAGKTQIIALGDPLVTAYAAGDGAEPWRAELPGGEVTPSPAFVGGLVLAVNPHNALLALKPDGAGDVTASHVAWKAEDDVPDVTSPVGNDELVFTVTSDGKLLCFDVKTGARVWMHELKQEVQASPAIAGGRLYLIGSNGVTIVAAVAREFKELARNELGEKIVASPAFVRGKIILRGLENLYCLAGETPKPGTP